MKIKTETVRGSELLEKVIVPMFVTRNRDDFVELLRQLKRYERARGSREETVATLATDKWGINSREYTGFYADRSPKALSWEKVDQTIFVIKPEPRTPIPYTYIAYSRSGGYTRYAQNAGLLAHSRFNREIRNRDVDKYAKSMQGGHWNDLLSDPITITDDGQVVNGQHRLAAASKVDWQKVSYDPLFLVVWNVAPEEALHADLSSRTAKEQATIAAKTAGEYIPSAEAASEGEVLDASVGLAA